MPTFTTQDGARLYYQVQGKDTDTGRPPLIFIHGWCSNHRHWAPQVRHFGRHHRILRMDRRGLGRSTTPGSGHTAEQHAQDIAAIAKVAGLRRAVAIGHAGGGPVTLALAARFPRLVKAAVIVDSSMYPLPRIGDPKSPFGTTLGSMVDAMEGPGGKAAFRKMYQGFFGPKCDKAVSSAAVADAMKTPLDLAVKELLVMAVSTEALAQEIGQPVLWLTAAAADQAYVRSHLANVQFGQVVGSGHFPQLEVPKQTNAMMETFIDQL